MAVMKNTGMMNFDEMMLPKDQNLNMIYFFNISNWIISEKINSLRNKSALFSLIHY